MKKIEQLIEDRIITEKDGYSEGRISLNVIIEIAKQYAQQCCEDLRQRCADSAEATIILSSEHPEFDYAKVNKHSILDVEIKLP